jgi:glucose/arabinose dehydrogenase
MGVIARFRPSGDQVEVFATGCRNIYEISIGPDKTIYRADNDADDYAGQVLALKGHREV